ncbi:hypothetical protein LTR99_000493 [Exophiala xenobiotica]|uniref:Uncharacterized protein n=1 Tax=Vermiconidia calcicola TaxID=1690605 RepID=A0AAV9QLA1_9PEZI|nr:hypothetical protein LTR92_003085 [Exophiala xenobiotica]KAK5543680.1 hypothetical protein LTR25_001294 [Vermiconidia calcicola]KAK5548357.1 hypothetical protein LTR23_001486 [Chaetothyriales sp. CCFEE 6169]KAK5213519.1 hypothetical protein LTR41_001098 [Exophiala xenobiotica]KAK5231192.1 hypothetical protein LTR72_000372 [Exophiala xenobiotica]
MAISFYSTIKPSGYPSSLRSEPLLSPPLSHNSSEDIPFRPDDSDRISLTMKKHKGHRHGWHDPFSPHTLPANLTVNTRQLRRRHSLRKRSRTSISDPLRKARSLPDIQSDQRPCKTELVINHNIQTRRWTVPSKAAATRGLATIIPVPEPTGRISKKTVTTQSPAMITLRRATTTGSPKRMSLTSFPTPKFGRQHTGFLSSLLNTITGQDEYRAGPSESLQAIGSNSQTTRSPWVDSNEARPATGAIAPPMFTAFTPIPPRLSLPGQGCRVFDPMRRCSTKYVCGDVVYEVIWDENSSTPSSESAGPSPVERDIGIQGNYSDDAETLERRLSKVLTQSRRPSTSAQMSRRTSYWPGSETFAQGLLPLMTSPKLAKIAREAAFRSLPRSKGSRKAEVMTPLATSIDVEQQLLLDPLTNEAGKVNVQYFPPLAGPDSSTEATRSTSLSLDVDRDTTHAINLAGDPFSGAPDEEVLPSPKGRSRYGSMVGVSSHRKRLSLPADTIPTVKSRKYSL